MGSLVLFAGFGFDDIFEEFGEIVAGSAGIPFDGLAVNSETAGIAPADELIVYVESWGGTDIDTLADTHIEADFLGYLVAGDIGVELVEVAFAFGDFYEIFVE